ncbi:hypothetical protein Tco_1195644 [Tanacetum coccineum]
MDICHALADLGSEHKSTLPLLIGKNFLFPNFHPTRMTLEISATRSITTLRDLAEDVYVKVGTSTFRRFCKVVDFEADPREITLLFRVDNKAVTFNLDQTMKYSSTDDNLINRIDIIDEICEEYAPELLGFLSDDFSSGNPTLTSEPFTSEFTLEEIDAYLYDKSISLESDHDDCDPEGIIYFVLDLLLND